MLCVLSPAKAMDLSGEPNCGVMSQPVMKQMKDLLLVCKGLKAADMKRLMGVSDDIAAKDVERYKTWDKCKSKAAALAMDGPAYRGFDASSLSPPERKLAQTKVRILSGLYGVLKPFDAFKPYRLEMGSKLKTSRGHTLYEFWGEAIANELAKHAKIIVNAASQEYWKAVDVKALGVPVITVDFPGPSVYAKKARGLICRYVVQNKCVKPEELKAFKGVPGDSYVFDERSSTKAKFVFRRVGSSRIEMSTAKRPSEKEPSKKRPASALPSKTPKRLRKV